MKKLGVIIILAAFVITAPAFARFWPIYWVIGSVQEAEDGVNADGRYVYFYKNETELNSGRYSIALIGPAGAAGKSGRYMLNTYGPGLADLEVGKTYYVAIPNDKPDNPEQGYGASPVSFTVSGRGYDEAPVMALAKGTSPFKLPPPPLGQEAGPGVKIWFGNRLYQPAVLKAGQKFVISDTPLVKAKISIEEPYAVSKNIDDYSVEIDPGTAASRKLVLSASHMVSQSLAAGELKAFTLQYSIGKEEKLEEGGHVFQVRARSSGALGIPVAVSQLATVEVMGGPLRLIGVPLTYPSPYSIRAHGIVTVQYELSQNANIDIYISGVGGMRVKRFVLNAGGEGGSAGVNKITWDGRTDQGYLAGNAIYVGTIIARDEGRLLGKFKLTIVD